MSSLGVCTRSRAHTRVDSLLTSSRPLLQVALAPLFAAVRAPSSHNPGTAVARRRRLAPPRPQSCVCGLHALHPLLDVPSRASSRTPSVAHAKRASSRSRAACAPLLSRRGCSTFVLPAPRRHRAVVTARRRAAAASRHELPAYSFPSKHTRALHGRSRAPIVTASPWFRAPLLPAWRRIHAAAVAA